MFLSVRQCCVRRKDVCVRRVGPLPYFHNPTLAELIVIVFMLYVGLDSWTSNSYNGTERLSDLYEFDLTRFVHCTLYSIVPRQKAFAPKALNRHHITIAPHSFCLFVHSVFCRSRIRKRWTTLTVRGDIPSGRSSLVAQVCGTIDLLSV